MVIYMKLFYLYIGETYLIVQLLIRETRSEGTQADNWLLTSFKHCTLSSCMLRVETLVEIGMYIVVLYTTLISGIYIGFTEKIEAASSKKEVKRVEESVAEKVTSYLRINV